MGTNIKYYQPGQPITLFDYKVNQFCEGALFFESPKLSQPIELISEKTRRNIIIAAIAVILLYISVFVLTTTVLPIADGYLSLLKPAKKVEQIAIKDPNVYSTNYILAEENQSNEFRISIPKINLISEVIPNVDSTNEDTYKEKLKQGVAHANGSYYPGENGTVFLFSHSTDTIANIEQYNAKFFALKDLSTGDEIEINYKGKTYKYNVTDRKIINPDQLEEIRNSNSALILSTCFPPGTNWQRLIIYAEVKKI